MNRHLTPFIRFATLTVVLAGILMAGCHKSTDQPLTSSTPAAGNTDQMAQNQATPQPAPEPPSPPVEPAPLIVAPNTAISVTLDQAISSKTAATGQTFFATLRAPISVDGVIAIPKGAHVGGVVNDAKAAGRFKGGASLTVTLTSVNVDGRDYRIASSSRTMIGKGKGKRTAGLVGGGGAGGALIGGIAGGGKGALIGALVGAGAGTAGAAYTGQADVILSTETPLTFRLRQPVQIAAPH
jgi:hypothetical protein